MKKIFMILIDGLRSDALLAADHPFVKELMQTSLYAVQARSVMPSVTLPCHMSIFHSVEPSRHGTITNTYAPQVRPIRGLCEVLSGAGKKVDFYYDWEPLRDLSRPLSLYRSDFISGRTHGFDAADQILTDRAELRLKNGDVADFTFFYLCFVDESGHKHGWMSDEYMDSVKASLDRAQKLATLLPDDVDLILTADHGGHDRSHGTDADTDMNVPLFLRGQNIIPGAMTESACIIDIAPTVVKRMDLPADPDWEGKALI